MRNTAEGLIVFPEKESVKDIIDDQRESIRYLLTIFEKQNRDVVFSSPNEILHQRKNISLMIGTICELKKREVIILLRLLKAANKKITVGNIQEAIPFAEDAYIAIKSLKNAADLSQAEVLDHNVGEVDRVMGVYLEFLQKKDSESTYETVNVVGNANETVKLEQIIDRITLDLGLNIGIGFDPDVLKKAAVMTASFVQKEGVNDQKYISNLAIENYNSLLREKSSSDFKVVTKTRRTSIPVLGKKL